MEFHTTWQWIKIDIFCLWKIRNVCVLKNAQYNTVFAWHDRSLIYAHLYLHIHMHTHKVGMEVTPLCEMMDYWTNTLCTMS
jgi:hypothetical protein